MDYDRVSAAELGAALRGISLNLLTRDLRGEAAFLAGVFGCALHQHSDDYAIVRHGDMVMQLHADRTFAAHPLHSLLPEAGPRGAGMVLAPARDKPGHGLREAVILSPSGYAFVPSLRL